MRAKLCCALTITESRENIECQLNALGPGGLGCCPF